LFREKQHFGLAKQRANLPPLCLGLPFGSCPRLWCLLPGLCFRSSSSASTSPPSSTGTRALATHRRITVARLGIKITKEILTVDSIFLLTIASLTLFSTIAFAAEQTTTFQADSASLEAKSSRHADLFFCFCSC
jgi:hypothetical protein